MSPSAVSAQPPHTNGKTSSSTKPTVPAPPPNNDSSSKIPAWPLRLPRQPAPGALFARITNPTPATVAYSSVQASRDLHIELNSDLVYINHSCAPSLVFDMARWEIRVSDKGEGLKEGDELTFFYPSTEWDMAQPFDCLCKKKECVGRVAGARDMDESVLGRYWLNAHVEELLEERRKGMV
ncbi:hypothetical protein PTNB73_09082 [Pyrenophora teres f. teres]|nr:hypothetical protein HRS9139_09305 [Pyrenophora teres f. teres]KAE8857834.1 hypothetical protein PTNB73_09082 [Pyrenophora teres f. teres]